MTENARKKPVSRGRKTSQEKNSNSALTLEVPKHGDETREQGLARILINANIKATYTMQNFSPDFLRGADYGRLQVALDESTKKIQENDLSDCEALLIAQAHTLDTMFHRISMMALSNTSPEPFKMLMNMALKAQNNSRMTLETLAEMKNPRPYIQNNKAEYQQVNNGGASSRAHTDERQKTTNKLLEADSGEWLDTGTQGTPGGADKELETVGAIDRTQDRPGKDGS